MGEDSGATAIASVPNIDNGLEKAVMLEMFVMAQIRVRYVTFLINIRYEIRSRKIISRILFYKNSPRSLTATDKRESIDVAFNFDLDSRLYPMCFDGIHA
ncbi:hypothetical protein AAE478_009752 [Parahypoxylon ruwenzoriense]